MYAVMFLLNVYQSKVDPGFVPSLLPHMLGAVTLPGVLTLPPGVLDGVACAAAAHGSAWCLAVHHAATCPLGQ